MFKILILVLSFVFGVHNDLNFLKKFHQSDYVVKFTRLEMVSFDKEIVNEVSVKTFKYNRTTTAFNVTWSTKIDFGNKTEFVLKASKLLNNEYRRVPASFQLNFCQIIEHNIFGLGKVGSCGNVTTCNVMKGVTYHVCNFVPNGAHMPPFLPNGNFLIDIHPLYLQREVAIVNCYIEVDRVIPIPKG